MIPEKEKLRFFTDQNVPESVARALEKHGHEVIRLKDKIATNSQDSLVAAVSEANRAILVTADRDFKSIAKRTSIGQRRFRTLSLIRFEKCRESQMARHMEEMISLIEHEWGIGNGLRDRRLFVVICSDVVRSHR